MSGTGRKEDERQEGNKAGEVCSHGRGAYNQDHLHGASVGQLLQQARLRIHRQGRRQDLQRNRVGGIRLQEAFQELPVGECARVFVVMISRRKQMIEAVWAFDYMLLRQCDADSPRR